MKTLHAWFVVKVRLRAYANVNISVSRETLSDTRRHNLQLNQLRHNIINNTKRRLEEEINGIHQ